MGSFQAVHTRAADAYIDLQSMNLSFLRAGHVLAYEETVADESIAIAKYWASEAGARITAAAQHLHGGIGVDVDYPLHRTYLWARQLGMQLGAGPEQLARIGADLADCAPDLRPRRAVSLSRFASGRDRGTTNTESENVTQIQTPLIRQGPFRFIPASPAHAVDRSNPLKRVVFAN